MCMCTSLSQYCVQWLLLYNVFPVSPTLFHISKHISSEQEECRVPTSSVGDRGTVPAPSLAARGATSPPDSASPPGTAVSSLTVTQTHQQQQKVTQWHTKCSELPKGSGPHLPNSVKYHDLQPPTLWGAQQHPRLPSSLLLLLFQAAFSNWTPTKIHKKPSVKIPDKPYRNPAAEFWLSTEPLYINARENTLAQH